jgi:diaminopimelate epimerase
MIFSKYEGAGNDFVLIDNRSLSFDPSLVSRLCNRKWGIGADGVILLQLDPSVDLRMRIFNSDGGEVESCGNGLRCFVQFALSLNLSPKRIAMHDRIVEAFFHEGQVGIRLGEPRNLCLNLPLTYDGVSHTVHFVNTGVPHVVSFTSDLDSLDINSLGKKIRHHPAFSPQGTNVNFAFLQPDCSLFVRTFERGVEAETLACGTGAAAVGVIASQIYNLSSPIRIHFAGGDMDITFSDTNFFDLSLIGPARHVFSGFYCL